MPCGVVAPIKKFIIVMIIRIIGGFMEEKLFQILTSGSVQAFLKYYFIAGAALC